MCFTSNNKSEIGQQAAMTSEHPSYLEIINFLPSKQIYRMTLYVDVLTTLSKILRTPKLKCLIIMYQTFSNVLDINIKCILLFVI